MCPVSGDAGRHVSREAFPIRSSSGSLSGRDDFFLQLLPLLASMWQQVLGHLASLERFLPQGHSWMRPLQLCLKDHWSPTVDDLAIEIPLSEEFMEAVRWWLQEDGWGFGVPVQVPPPSLLLHTDVCLSGWGIHLLDLTALCVWSMEEGSMHSYVPAMMAVSRALAMLLPQLSDQSVVLLSANVAIVASLRYQAGTVFYVLCRMAAEVVLWTERHSVSLMARCIPGKNNV